MDYLPIPDYEYLVKTTPDNRQQRLGARSEETERTYQAFTLEHVVISATGKMAFMKTVAPATFVAFKRWMAESAPQRPQAKRRRDLRQAAIVQALLDEGLLVP